MLKIGTRGYSFFIWTKWVFMTCGHISLRKKRQLGIINCVYDYD
ncbi:hypothetical protein HMPREF3191_00832 [Veillonellaceae bacterium DNF00626]|nr:hypothetical protein HMPREF3191_00832 [Veillonellaceae bacterium DNF00626]